ncbi:MAG: chromosomal replication initiator protein DnaA [Armatimonadota bacterium]
MRHQLRLEIEETGPLHELWSEVLQAAETRLGRESVESWLKDTGPVSLEEGVLTIGAPNSTARTWIEKKYAGVLAEVLEQVHGESARIAVVVRSRKKGAEPSQAAAAPKAAPAPPAQPARPVPSPLFAPLPLNEKYTFENYVVGQSNRFAHAAAAAVADRPGREFNPLFIYGGVGLGKTHLLQAIGHGLRAKNPRARVAYVSGETFTSHFITSLREHREEEFRRAYRGVDIWLVDDIQFIADKTSTKEEFFHTFNELYLTNRQIVLASDRPPRELRLMEDRLRTRLESGLLVEIAAPELETRMAILQKRAELEGADVPPELVYQIARTVTTNVRVLEAALIRMLALASLNNCGLTPELAGRALAAFVQESQIAAVSLLAIQRAVSEQFKVPEQELTGPRRDRHTSLARQVAMYLMRELTRKSLSEIGEAFGGKSHSTVLYSCSKLEKEMQQDPSLQTLVRALRTRIAGHAGE